MCSGVTRGAQCALWASHLFDFLHLVYFFLPAHYYPTPGYEKATLPQRVFAEWEGTSVGIRVPQCPSLLVNEKATPP